jgi:predicted small secreted protein
MRRRTLAVVLAVVSGGAVLAACGTEEPSTGAGTDVAHAEYASGGSGGDDALLSGTARVADGCLVVEENDSGTVYTPVFPKGADLPADGDQMSLPGGAHDERPEFASSNGCESGPFWVVAAEG